MNLKSTLRNVASQVEHLNTNNGWGFGGAVEDVFTVKGYKVTLGKACYRHLPSENFYKVETNDEVLIKTYRRKDFVEILTNLQLI